jgi:hypothetical protein
MAIDFCVDYACDAKQMLGTESLLQLVQARVAYDATQRSGNRRREHDFWTRVVRGPEKDRVEMVSVGQLRRSSNRLIEFTAACKECPANVRGGPAGCFGRITYPIDAQTERHLAAGVAAVTAAPEAETARTFVRWIDDGPVDGRRVRRMREAVRTGVRFFELQRPLSVPAPDSEPATTEHETGSSLTTDQVIELMFFAFPHGGDGFHFSVPRDALSSHRAFLDFILNELDLGHRREALEQSTTLEQLRLYARALAIADDLKVDLLVD